MYNSITFVILEPCWIGLQMMIHMEKEAEKISVFTENFLDGVTENNKKMIGWGGGLALRIWQATT